ncbi:hypothetical protein [Burkholderia sp. Ac-20379]|uniref:hypothetical protein n=1 Tax=Burkholderia sp. Ac-20379 TaxID=2703900 RepID=UPI001F121B82|nr:hypothetical protein [Burkholderia sp. Ac-20379]
MRIGPLSQWCFATTLALSVLPAAAQIAHPVGEGAQPATISPPPAATTVTAATAPSAPPSSPAAAKAPRPMLYYVCGNAGIDSQVHAPDPQHPFNLGVNFASSNPASPPSDVAVKVRRHGRVLMDFVAAGPNCRFSLPDAEYRVEATYQGTMKFDIVKTGTLDARIAW